MNHEAVMALFYSRSSGLYMWRCGEGWRDLPLFRVITHQTDEVSDVWGPEFEVSPPVTLRNGDVVTLRLIEGE